MSDCLICGGRLSPCDYPGLLRCRSCSFLTADLQLSDDQLRTLYSSSYFCGEEYRDYLAEQSTLERNFVQRLRCLLRFVPHARSKHLFEIGCAYGFFLKTAAPFFASVEGIDISTEAVWYAQHELGFCASAGTFDEYIPKNHVDVAVIWDTIEHLSRPDTYIRKLTGLMDPGGIVAITTGDLESLVARARKTKWRQIHPPTHLHYFSKSTLARLLEKNGFTIRFVQHCGNYRTLDTAFYTILVLRRDYAWLYKRLRQTGLLNVPFYLNLYDTLFIIAEKS